MDIVALVESLVKTGATPEMILAAVKSQSEAIAQKREGNRLRKQKQREEENKKSLEINGHVTVTSCDVTVTECDKISPPFPPLLPSPTPPSNNPPITPPKNSASNAGTQARGVNLLNPEKPILEINIAGWLEEACESQGWKMNLSKASFENFAEKMANAVKTPQAWKLAWVKWYSNEFYRPPQTGQPAYEQLKTASQKNMITILPKGKKND